MNIGGWLAEQARLDPTCPALFAGRDLVADYGGFHDQAGRVSAWLRGRGVCPGDRVAIFMSNRPDYLIALYGIWYAGAVAVPINAKLHAREATWIMDDANAQLCLAGPAETELLSFETGLCPVIDVTGGDFAAALCCPPDADPVARAPEDMAWLFYTSGTTGRSKGVVITHRMLMTMSLAYQTDVDQVRSEDATIYAAPMSHGAGLYNMVHVRMGARHVCPLSGGFEPAELFDLAAYFGNAHLFAAPTMVRRLTDAARGSGRTGTGLRTIVYAGGPMYLADIVEAVDRFGSIFVQIYGQGECPMGITALSRHDVSDRSHPRWRDRLASVGRAQSPVEVGIRDAAGRPVGPGERGEIMVRGDVVMPGYWRNPEATGQSLKDGWLLTGDIGSMDQDGYVTLHDRSKDMIISGGSNIYPREVEEVLLTHPDVQEASVVGETDAEWGEIVVAFVVGDVESDDLDRLCLDNIARFKRPRRYVSVSELPKNNYGKVLKTELRRLLEPSRLST